MFSKNVQTGNMSPDNNVRERDVQDNQDNAVQQDGEDNGNYVDNRDFSAYPRDNNRNYDQNDPNSFYDNGAERVIVNNYYNNATIITVTVTGTITIHHGELRVMTLTFTTRTAYIPVGQDGILSGVFTPEYG